MIFDFNYTSHLSSIFTESDKHVVGNASERGLRRGGKKPTTITGEGGIYVHSHTYIHRYVIHKPLILITYLICHPFLQSM